MSLGLERAGGFTTTAFCEVDPDCRAVLSKHWPDVPLFDDIRELRGSAVGDADVITAGFPCQDVSQAHSGGLGLDGEKSGLWAHVRRLIEELEPRYVLIENVANLRNRGLIAVLQDLWKIGYDAEWHCIPATAVGLPHARDRIWILAYPASLGVQECIADRCIPFAAPPEKPGFADGWVSEWLASRIRSRVVPLGHGLPGRLARIALKQYGNAVVPQIPEALGRAILEYERSSHGTEQD